MLGGWKPEKIFLFNHRDELFSGTAIFLYLYTCPGQSFGPLEFDITQAYSLFLLESFSCHLNIFLERFFPQSFFCRCNLETYKSVQWLKTTEFTGDGKDVIFLFTTAYLLLQIVCSNAALTLRFVFASLHGWASPWWCSSGWCLARHGL